MRNTRHPWFPVLLALTTLAPAWGKSVRHPAGFRFEIPDGWNVENGPNIAAILPPGVRLDPNREDNPEIYTVYGSSEGGEDIVEMLKADLTGAPVTEAFRVPGKAGAVLTFDFDHPVKKTKMRVRIFSLTVKGKQITLVASGLRERLQAREKTLREIAQSLDYER